VKVEIINVGDELLIGQVVNTNAAWMSGQLNLAGFLVDRIIVIGDKRQEILDSLKDAHHRSEIILMTGGLGPTKDDITKDALCRFFNTRLVFNQEAYENIEKFFLLRGIPVTSINRKQAEVPGNCTPLPNKNGTAPGLWFETEKPDHEGKVIFISMPGVPFEMKAMLTDQVIPLLKKHFRTQAIIHKTILTQGIGESFLSDIIESWENQLPESISLAYLPQPGIVRLRLTGTGPAEDLVRSQMDEEITKLRGIIPDYIYGSDDERLEEIVGTLLKQKSFTFATAESCTGGYIAHLITSVPGSSGYFKGSIIAYSNEVKERELKVNPESILHYGAVSEAVVREMAINIRRIFNVDYAIATSGIAGPDGGTNDKPVGTSWISIATPTKVLSKKYLFGENRERNIRRTALQALNLLRKEIIAG
jgi:nicotinamide-nucleotide amidase